mgnify:CR=1 FL=1
MAKKKSLYELLDVQPSATESAIRAAYQARLQALEDQKSTLSHEDYNMQQRLLRVAYNTLSSSATRNAYDAQLAERSQQARSPATTALQIVPIQPPHLGSDLRTDAMLLRAEALALRANALELKADAGMGYPLATDNAVAAGVKSVLNSGKKVIFFLGIFMDLGMVLKVIALLALPHYKETSSSERSEIDEKIYLQEYFQTYGVRPASRAEAQLMDIERRKSESAQRAREQAQEKNNTTDRSQRDFEEAARRRADQASAELRYAEEAAQAARQEERLRKEEAELQRQEAERRRVEQLQDGWRRTLGTSNNN